MKPVYIIIGIPGSGKNTQGELLAKKLGYKHIDAGDTIKAYLSLHPGFAASFNSGPFPTSELLKVLKMEVTKNLNYKGIIFTQHSKDSREFDEINEMLRKLGCELKKVFCLNISRETAISRSMLRLGGKFTEKEPNVAKIVSRIDSFLNLIPAFKNYCADKGILVDINGELSQNEVFENILAEINMNFEVYDGTDFEAK